MYSCYYLLLNFLNFLGLQRNFLFVVLSWMSLNEEICWLSWILVFDKNFLKLYIVLFVFVEDLMLKLRWYLQWVVCFWFVYKFWLDYFQLYCYDLVFVVYIYLSIVQEGWGMCYSLLVY